MGQRHVFQRFGLDGHAGTVRGRHGAVLPPVRAALPAAVREVCAEARARGCAAAAAAPTPAVTAEVLRLERARAAAPLVPLALCYVPAGPERDAGLRLLLLLLVALVATGTPVAVGLAVYGACAPLAAYATALGLSCAVAYVVMYLPQLAETLRRQSAGALSYGFLALHILLGIASALQKAEGTHERVVTWAPPLVANFMQAVLIGLNLYFDTREFALGGGEAAGERTPLKGGDSDDYGAAAPGAAAVEEAGQGQRVGRAVPPPHPELFSREWWDRYL